MQLTAAWLVVAHYAAVASGIVYQLHQSSTGGFSFEVTAVICAAGLGWFLWRPAFRRIALIDRLVSKMNAGPVLVSSRQT